MQRLEGVRRARQITRRRLAPPEFERLAWPTSLIRDTIAAKTGADADVPPTPGIGWPRTMSVYEAPRAATSGVARPPLG